MRRDCTFSCSHLDKMASTGVMGSSSVSGLTQLRRISSVESPVANTIPAEHEMCCFSIRKFKNQANR